MISLGQLERRFGGLSFPGFLRYYAMIHALVYLIQLVRPDIGELLEFNRTKIFAGEVWRVVTFLFASSGSFGTGGINLIIMVFLVRVCFMMSAALEDAWGVFKATLFYWVGIVGLIVANFLLPQVLPGSGFLLYGAAFFAFATLFPKVEFLLFFILPVQVRFLAWFLAAGLVLFVLADWRLLPFFLLGHANYLIFAGLPALRGTARVIEAAQRKRRFNAAKEPASAAFHTCAACDRTDVTDRELEFRVGRDGREYCEEHLPG
jgi:hypothetical protein